MRIGAEHSESVDGAKPDPIVGVIECMNQCGNT